jgi:hypothetical protein
LLTRSYLQDYDEKVGTGSPQVLADPVIGTAEAGLRAEVVNGENGPELAFRLASLVSFGEFTTKFRGTGVVSIELPELVLTSGTLGVSSVVNVVELGRLEGGETLALVVRRVD